MRRFLIVLTLNLTLITMLSVHYIYAGKLNKAPEANVYMKPTQDTSSKDVSSLSGKVIETMNSGGYTYLCIEKDGIKTWVAVPEMKITVGEETSLQPGYEMVNFTSKTLNRTFDKIIFSNGPISKQGTIDVKSFHNKPSEGKGTVTATDEKIKVEKASGPNAYMVAELFEKKAELDQKNVVISGKVVKVSAGIMRKNWLHIQDGSGNTKDRNNDLVVTTQDLPSVDDIVTVTGTLYKDKDFGSGYKYDVIIEDAHIKK